MAIRTFDHSGFIVEDIPRAHKYYEALFGARPLFMANLSKRTYEGWPFISFVAMGKHRFELCLARHSLPPAEASCRGEIAIDDLIDRAKSRARPWL